MSKYWIVVAAAEHVRRGVAGGFVQACHGKVGPLRRMAPGDGIVCYSPTATFRGDDRLQAFTAIGHLIAREPYLVAMDDRRPARRDILWLEAKPAPIAPLLDMLTFTAGRRNWGYLFRFGVVAIEESDFSLIAAAMMADAASAAA